MRVGDRYGRWVVTALIPHPKNPMAACVCDCGATGSPQRGALVSGKSASCGCLRMEKLIKAAKTHGLSKSRPYRIWQNMVRRCQVEADKHYHNYGGRGIRVEWEKFEDFIADMGMPPDGALLERVDNNGNYSKENCIWAGWREQSRNKRISRIWVVDGRKFESSPDAAAYFGVDTSTVHRWCRGGNRNGKWTPPKAGCSSFLKYEQ